MISDFVPTTGKEYVKEINITISNKYMVDAYESCKQVVMPQTGQLAMDMACGMPTAICDPYK